MREAMFAPCGKGLPQYLPQYPPPPLSLSRALFLLKALSSSSSPSWCLSHRFNLSQSSGWVNGHPALLRPPPPPTLSFPVESDDWLLIATSPPFFTYVKLLVERARARSCGAFAALPRAAEQSGDTNWSVYLFIAFQDIICFHGISSI